MLTPLNPCTSLGNFFRVEGGRKPSWAQGILLYPPERVLYELARVSCRVMGCMDQPIIHEADTKHGAAEAASESVSFLTPRVEVIQSGQVIPIVPTKPLLINGWKGVALEAHTTGPCDHPDHEHPTHFVQLQLRGPVRYSWTTNGVTRVGTAEPGTLFLCPRGSRDRVEWLDPTDRVLLSIEHPVITKVLEETAAQDDVELQQSFEMRDRHIASLILALRADLEDGSPAGHLYGDSLITALAVYIQRRYAVFRHRTAQFRGGMPSARLKRVIEYVEANLGEDISLSALAQVAGMGPHYFCDLFKQSIGLSPHRFVLRQKLERAKKLLRNPKTSVIEISAILGFADQSYFTKVFHKAVGVTPTEFRANLIGRE